MAIKKINTMATISRHDFQFLPVGHGRYKVTYFSPKTGKSYSAEVTDMTIIDATKNADKVMIKDLKTLKAICKRG